jgi:hypothetical protein
MNACGRVRGAIAADQADDSTGRHMRGGCMTLHSTKPNLDPRAINGAEVLIWQQGTSLRPPATFFRGALDAQSLSLQVM